MISPKLVQKIVKFLAKYFPHLKMPGTDFMSSFDEAFKNKNRAAAGRLDPFIQEAVSMSQGFLMAASAIGASETIWKKKQEIYSPFIILIMGADDVHVYIPDSEGLYYKARIRV
jgi:hypothetical protein